MRGECVTSEGVRSEGVRGAGVEPRDTLGEFGLIPTNGRGFLLNDLMKYVSPSYRSGEGERVLGVACLRCSLLGWGMEAYECSMSTCCSASSSHTHDGKS